MVFEVPRHTAAVQLALITAIFRSVNAVRVTTEGPEMVFIISGFNVAMIDKAGLLGVTFTHPTATVGVGVLVALVGAVVKRAVMQSIRKAVQFHSVFSSNAFSISIHISTAHEEKPHQGEEPEQHRA